MTFGHTYRIVSTAAADGAVWTSDASEVLLPGRGTGMQMLQARDSVGQMLSDWRRCIEL